MLEGVTKYQKGKRQIILTRNASPGKAVYGESLVQMHGSEYREWDHTRSKLAAAIMKGLNETGIKKDSIILYLGAASGTTVSHLSDIAENGFIFAVEFAPRVMRDLIFLCSERKNIAPVLADANRPESYTDKMTSADVLYQDIAQKNQVEIFLKNADIFLENGGYAMLSLKARSIDISARPRDIYAKAKEEIGCRLRIIDMMALDPFEKDHCFFLCRKQPK
jgi:fibrillarin-like pre-rRNA processing protein